MTAEARILGWKAEGLRCPDHEIACCDESDRPYPVTLIQMPNGTGKTTTLTLLRAALSGSAATEHWDASTVQEYRKREPASSSGTFDVRLLLNERRITVRMLFDFDAGRVGYKTTRGHGQVSGFEPPADFSQFLNPSFVSFFVFDGELAQHLLDRRHTDAEVVVESLFQIDTLRTMASKVAEYWDMQTESVSATEQRGLARRRNRLATLRARYEKLCAEQERLRTRRAEVEERANEQYSVYQHEIQKQQDQSNKLTDAQHHVDDLDQIVRTQALDALDSMRDPHALSSQFASQLKGLKEGLDRVKLPESAAREFFEELAQEDECVCGRPIDSQVRERIRERASHYLATDDVSLLNAMKGEIQEAVGDSLDRAESELHEQLSSLEESVEKRREAMQKRDTLAFQAEEADPEARTARERYEELAREVATIDEELAKFEDKDDSLGDERTTGLAVLKRRLEDADRKVAEITNTLELKEKRDILQAILSDAHDKAKAGITKALCAEANTRIAELMPDNRISIEDLDRSLVLEGQESASAGETLSIAYAFLATLFNRAEHTLPFIVDSPAGPIDYDVRPEIGHLVPRLTSQFVAFIISSERPYFVDALKHASPEEVHFITVFRKGTKGEKRSNANDGETRETDDGVVVLGERFFNSFQADTE